MQITSPTCREPKKAQQARGGSSTREAEVFRLHPLDRSVSVLVESGPGIEIREVVC